MKRPITHASFVFRWKRPSSHVAPRHELVLQRPLLLPDARCVGFVVFALCPLLLPDVLPRGVHMADCNARAPSRRPFLRLLARSPSPRDTAAAGRTERHPGRPLHAGPHRVTGTGRAQVAAVHRRMAHQWTLFTFGAILVAEALCDHGPNPERSTTRSV